MSEISHGVDSNMVLSDGLSGFLEAPPPSRPQIEKQVNQFVSAHLAALKEEFSKVFEEKIALMDATNVSKELDQAKAPIQTMNVVESDGEIAFAQAVNAIESDEEIASAQAVNAVESAAIISFKREVDRFGVEPSGKVDESAKHLNAVISRKKLIKNIQQKVANKKTTRFN